MAQKRMFSNAVIDNDRFLDMPLSAQALYFHLGMKADDDGFVGSPKKTVRAVNCSEDDLRLLIAKGFVLCFDSGVVVITHWNAHNTIQKDRYTKTMYQEEFALLTTENKTYRLSDGDKTDTAWIQTVSDTETQIRLDKNRVDKNRIDSSSASADTRAQIDDHSVIDCFNSVCKSLPKVQKLTEKRRRAIKNARKLLGEMTFAELFAKVEQSDFLTGRTNKWNGCGFDWILQPSNLTKIVEGNYDNKQTAERSVEESGCRPSYDIEELEKIDTLDFMGT
ncbi:MAG: phage replication initiation protein [Ruminococcus sp.]|nr:phage replication initiation protein [Ruminococcus sp.]